MKKQNAERIGTKEHSRGIPICGCGVGHKLGSRRIASNPLSNNVILTWFLKCDGRFSQNGHEYLLCDNCVCLRKAEQPYILEITDTSYPRLYLYMRSDLFDFLQILIPELMQMPPVWEFHFSQDAFDAFFDLYDHLKKVSSNEFYQLIPVLARYILLVTGIQQRRDMFPLEKGKRLLEDNQTLSLEEIANKCGMTYHSFRKQFSATYQISPGQYRIQKRIDAAKRWLKCGLSVKETADLMGYADMYTFSHQFTNIVGISPGKYGQANSALCAEDDA